MAVILDTDLMAPGARARAIKDAMAYASVPCEVTHRGPADAAWARVAYTPLGPTAEIVSHQGSGLRMTRQARHLRVAAPERISLALHGPGSGAMIQPDVTRVLQAGEMLLVDLTAPYDYWFSARGSSSFQVDYDDLDISVAVARAAAARLGRSPLYGLVRDHLARLCRDAGVLSLPPVLHCLRSHLADRDLGAEQIASAHGISVRQLQRTWSEMGVELRDWITAERLEADRCELARSDPVAGSVADVARHWGFTGPADSRARCQAAFGISAAWKGPGDQARDEGPVPG